MKGYNNKSNKENTYIWEDLDERGYDTWEKTWEFLNLEVKSEEFGE